MPHGTTFNAETAELAEHNRFFCGFREFCVDRRAARQETVSKGLIPLLRCLSIMDRIREHRSELLDSIQELVRVINTEDAESTEIVSHRDTETQRISVSRCLRGRLSSVTSLLAL